LEATSLYKDDNQRNDVEVDYYGGENMLDRSVFDGWANDYNEEVRIADENDEYPFAGYTKIMNHIFHAVQTQPTSNVLDVGVGTGTLATALYENGHTITAIDFSSEMLAITKQKMPNAMFYQHDFSNGLPSEIVGAKYDFIISTYALHHLPDERKSAFIKSLLPFLSDSGAVFIGDIGFPTRAEFDECHGRNADDWDDDEYYFVFEELVGSLENDCKIIYKQVSHCAGLLEIRAQ
jgi:putative AdoMet-dependent methyltransferase